MHEKTTILASSGGSAGFSALTSFAGLCCIGPALPVALLGVSGAVWVARLQPFWPFLLGAAGALLAWAFWRTYRLKRVCVAQGCAERKPGAATHLALWVSAALLLSALAVNLFQLPRALAADAARTSDAVNPTMKPYVVLDQNLDRLRADFNADAGKVRLLYIVGPTCAVCLRGLDDMQKAVLSKRSGDPRLVAFVVHVPALGAREGDIEPAMRLLDNRHATHYWDGAWAIGPLMGRALGYDRIPIWDFWAIYGPEAAWTDPRRPPKPDFWQHQLGELPPDQFLNPKVFAAKVDAFLAGIPASASK